MKTCAMCLEQVIKLAGNSGECKKCRATNFSYLDKPQPTTLHNRICRDCNNQIEQQSQSYFRCMKCRLNYRQRAARRSAGIIKRRQEKENKNALR